MPGMSHCSIFPFVIEKAMSGKVMIIKKGTEMCVNMKIWAVLTAVRHCVRSCCEWGKSSWLQCRSGKVKDCRKGKGLWPILRILPLRDRLRPQLSETIFLIRCCLIKGLLRDSDEVLSTLYNGRPYSLDKFWKMIHSPVLFKGTLSLVEPGNLVDDALTNMAEGVSQLFGSGRTNLWFLAPR